MSAAATSDTSPTVLTYNAGWPTNSISWSSKYPRRLAVASFINDWTNNVAIVQQHDAPGGDLGSAAQEEQPQGEDDEPPSNERLYRVSQFQHYYPPTKAAYGPSAAVEKSDEKDLFVTTGDYLRLWHLTDQAPGSSGQTAPNAGSGGEDAGQAVGSHPDQQQPDGQPTGAGASQTPGFVPATHSALPDVSANIAHLYRAQHRNDDLCAPLTSFDWNIDHPHMLATCSIDTTVTVWDLNTQEVNVQLIAHDKEVYDVAFSRGEHIFASAGADGSVRTFDLRKMDSCMIVYESPDNKPMLRVAWNFHEANYIAAVTSEGSQVAIIDTRYPSIPVGVLNQHTAPVNSIAWAPHSSVALCSAGEDKKAILWDVSELPASTPQTHFSHSAAAEINCVSWGPENLHQTDWVAVTQGNVAQMLHV